MKIKDGFVVEKVGGSYIAVAVGDRAEEINALIKMNGTGEFLFRCLSEADRSYGELLSLMTKEYEVDEEIAKRDILAFVDKLREGGLLDE